MVEEQMRRVVFGKTNKTREDSTKGVPFPVTSHPKLRRLKSSLNICIYRLSSYDCVYIYIELEYLDL